MTTDGPPEGAGLGPTPCGSCALAQNIRSWPLTQPCRPTITSALNAARRAFAPTVRITQRDAVSTSGEIDLDIAFG